MGPANIIRDQRIKLILPGPQGLVHFTHDASWYSEWRAMDPGTRGAMRTYSIRNLRRFSDTTELDVDFVLHTSPGATGPAATWALNAMPGDEIYVVAHDREDTTTGGIEFDPGDSQHAVMLGDETALPAIARTLAEWPAGVSGDVFIETPVPADRQELITPEAVNVTWFDRADGSEHGTHLVKALSALCGLQEATASASDEVGEPVWETPTFSRCNDRPADRMTRDDLTGLYFWIAGESGVVKRMRRMLVKEAGIPRQSVSFMGYWKRGVAMA